MQRKDWLWIIGFLFLALMYWRCRGIDGSGTSAMVTREVPAFSAIEVDGELRVEVAVRPERHVEITGDDNLLEYIETTVKGDRLVIESHGNLDPKVPLVVKVATPELRAIEGAGSVDIDVSGLDGKELALALSGSGTVDAEGRVDSVRLDLSGSAEVDLTKLAARDVAVDMSGSAEVDLAEPETLDVDISGSGTVRHGGNPRIRQDITGSGSIVHR